MSKIQKAKYIFFLIIFFGLFGREKSFAAISIALPYEQKFDTNAYVGQVVWISQEATHTWEPSGGWSGGAAKFTPPVTNEGYSGLGSFTGLSGTHINVRFLIYHGSTYVENEALQNKVIIIWRGMEQRPMIISRPYNNWMTYGSCDGTTCRYEGGDFWPDGTDSFRVGNPPNREEQWVSVEFEADSSSGIINTYIHTQDSALSGLYVSKTMGTPGEQWSAVDIIGGYFHPGGIADANNYFKIDELAISDRYIGPPAGFVTGGGDTTAPAAPQGLSVN